MFIHLFILSSAVQIYEFSYIIIIIIIIIMEFQWNPRGGSSLHCFQVKLEFGNVGFYGGRKTDENQQQTQPTYDAESGNQTRATLVGGECSTTAPSLLPLHFHLISSTVILLIHTMTSFQLV